MIEPYWDREPADGMVHATLVAVKKDGKWLLMNYACRPDGLDAVLRADGLSQYERRVVDHRHVNPAFLGQGRYIEDCALRAGWHKHRTDNNWYPMEEEYPWLSGEPSRNPVDFRLRSVAFGHILFSVSTPATTIECPINDVHDSLVLYARFVQLLAQGRCPHAALTAYPLTHFVVQGPPQEAESVRLFVRQIDEGKHKCVDVLMDRSLLLRLWGRLLATIADDESLGHMFLCHADMPDAEYGRVLDEAEADWSRLVVSGTCTDDEDEMYRFLGKRITAGVPLTAQQTELTARYRTMLRTLEVPVEWLRSHRLI